MKRLTIILWVLLLVGFSLIGCGEQKKSYTYTTIGGGGGGTPPTVTNVAPATVASGQKITITGSNFGASRSIREADESYVRFLPSDGIITGEPIRALIYDSWSDNQIICTVPDLPVIGERRALSYVIMVYVVSSGGTYFSSPTPGGGNSITAVAPNSVVGAISDALLGTGIPGAAVSAGGQNTITDLNGFYILSNVPAGQQTVTANKAGYQQNTTTVTVVPEVTVTGSIPLTPVVSPCGADYKRPDYYQDAGAWSIASADFNSDGVPDIAVADRAEGAMEVYMGNGDGTFTFDNLYYVETGFLIGPPTEITIGDFDLVNGPDIAVTHETSGITVFLNQGDGNFQDGQYYNAFFNPGMIAVADLNGDGYPDIANKMKGVSQIWILPNSGDGSGAFDAAITLNVPGGIGYSLALGDVNNDSLPDIVYTTNTAEQGVNVMFNQGNYTFGEAQSYELSNSGKGVALGNFDGVSGLDIAAANGDGVSVLANNGDGTFGAGQYYATGTNSQGVSCADYNNDGSPDLSVANFDSGTVSVLFNNGNGMFTKSTRDFTLSNSYPSGEQCYAMATGDFDSQDGIDIAALNQSPGSFTIFLNNGSGIFPLVANYAVGDEPRGAAVGDLNGDGNPDLVIPNRADRTISVLMGKGDGSFNPSVNYLAGTEPYSAAVCDFDGDGWLDVAVANRDYGYVSILFNYGDGTLKPRQDYAAGEGAEYVAAGDLNGDMLPDLAVANNEGNNISVLLNRGDGTFSGTINYPVMDAPTQVAIGDLDNDGYQDLVVGYNNMRGIISLLFNNGDGTFGLPQEYGTGYSLCGVVIGDVNNDGFMDIAVTDSEADTMQVYINNGDGTFGAPQEYEAGDGCRAPSMGDLNCDGYLDIVVSNENSNTISLFINNQDGTFADEVTYDTQTNPMAIAVCDLNGDGKPELSIPNRGSNNVTVYIHK